MQRKSLVRPFVVAGLVSGLIAGFMLTAVVAQAQTTKTRVGKLDFDGGYPSRKTVDRLYEEGLTTKLPGQRQILSVRKDVDGEWLQGEKSYTLRIPADPPVERYWALTLYDAETRCFIENKPEITGVDSRMDLIENEEGSIVLHFGPKAPEGKEQNWIQTVAGRGWFAYFRLYAPTDAFFDQSWKLPEIRRVDIDDDLYGGGG